MYFKKFTVLLLVFCLTLSLWGCGSNASGETTQPEPSVVPETILSPTEVPAPLETTSQTVPGESPALPAELAAYDQVFQGTRAITRAASDEVIPLSKISLFFTVDELPWGIAQLAVLDLDSDGTLEAVLEVENYAGYVILTYRDGAVLGTEVWYRAFQELKADGSFQGSGSSVNRYYWRYHPEGNILLAECYEEENNPPYYSIGGEAATPEAFAAFEEAQTAKPAATWFPSWQDFLASR